MQWGKYVENAQAYPERDPAYHAVNKVRYRWFFTRVNPVGPPIEPDVQGGNGMTLIPPHDTPLPKVAPPPRLRYTGALPASLIVGQEYMLTLRVEHADMPPGSRGVAEGDHQGVKWLRLRKSLGFTKGSGEVENDDYGTSGFVWG